MERYNNDRDEPVRLRVYACQEACSLCLLPWKRIPSYTPQHAYRRLSPILSQMKAWGLSEVQLQQISNEVTSIDACRALKIEFQNQNQSKIRIRVKNKLPTRRFSFPATFSLRKRQSSSKLSPCRPIPVAINSPHFLWIAFSSF